MLNLNSRRARAAVALGFALTLAAVALGFALTLAAGADARPMSGSSAGSRGGRTYSAPAPTQTAPAAPRPIERSATQPAPQMQRPGLPPQPQAAPPRRFGFGTGLMAGLLGAGLLGVLTGHGFFGGLAGLASVLGLLFQVALIAGLIWLALRFFRRRSEPALAGAGAPYARSALGPMPAPGGQGGGQGPGRGAGPARRDEIGIGPDDYAAFERALREVQTAFGREDLGALRRLATPQMASYFAEELEANRARGVVNRLSDVRLFQGDLSEAWREGPTDYATVAMRYRLADATVERASGRIVAGNPTAPTEVTEVWTFRRDHGSPWVLSAIQQTA